MCSTVEESSAHFVTIELGTAIFVTIVIALERRRPKLITSQSSFPDRFTDIRCVSTISLTRNRSVSKARRWIDAFRLSIN